MIRLWTTARKVPVICPPLHYCQDKRKWSIKIQDSSFRVHLIHISVLPENGILSVFCFSHNLSYTLQWTSVIYTVKWLSFLIQGVFKITQFGNQWYLFIPSSNANVYLNLDLRKNAQCKKAYIFFIRFQQTNKQTYRHTFVFNNFKITDSSFKEIQKLFWRKVNRACTLKYIFRTSHTLAFCASLISSFLKLRWYDVMTLLSLVFKSTMDGQWAFFGSSSIGSFSSSLVPHNWCSADDEADSVCSGVGTEGGSARMSEGAASLTDSFTPREFSPSRVSSSSVILPTSSSLLL